MPAKRTNNNNQNTSSNQQQPPRKDAAVASAEPPRQNKNENNNNKNNGNDDDDANHREIINNRSQVTSSPFPKGAVASAGNSLPNNNNNSNVKKIENSTEDENAAFKLWFCPELVQHVLQELQQTNNNNGMLIAAFNSVHEKVREACSNYSSLLEAMRKLKDAKTTATTTTQNATTTNSSLQNVVSELEGTILDITVLEQMISWENTNNNNNNTNNNAAASTESLFLGTLCFLNAFASAEPQLAEPNIVALKVDKATPYWQFERLCNRLSIACTLRHAADQFTALINSTITKYNDMKKRQKLCVTITERIRQRHFELKMPYEKLPFFDTPPALAQANLLENCNCFYSCSWKAVDACGERFTFTPVGLRDQFVGVHAFKKSSPTTNDDSNSTPAAVATAKETSPAPSNYFTGRVNIVVGPSGSGKTISTLLAAPPGKFPVVHNILLHVGIDCCANGDVLSDKGNRDRETKRQLLRGILRALVVPQFDAEEHLEKLPSNQDTEAQMWEKFSELMKSSSLRRLLNSNVVVRIVVDEIGKTPSFLRGLCSVWLRVRAKLAEVFRMEADCLELFVVGTGAENFQMSPPGSFPTAYQLFTVNREKAMFKELLRRFRNGYPEETGLVKELYKILVTEANKQTDPIIKAIIRMSSNARCGAIIMSFIKKTTKNIESVLSYNPGQSTWTFDQVRSVISGWCPLIAAVFATKNSLRAFSSNTNGLKYVLGRAIGFSLNRDRQLVPLGPRVDKNNDASILAAVQKDDFKASSNKVWKDYGVRFGLLLDTAVRIDSEDFTPEIEKEHDLVYAVNGEDDRNETFNHGNDNDTDGNNSTAKNKNKNRSRAATKKMKFYFIVKKGEPRYLIDEAFVTMFRFLTHSTSTGVFSVSHPSTDLLFEEANWDFARTAAQFGKQVSVKEILENLDEDYFTPPHLLYGLGVNKLYSQHLIFRLEEAIFSEESTKSENELDEWKEFNKSVAFWRKAIQDEDAACVLLNGDNAESADMFVLAKNRIVLTRFTNTFKVDNVMAHQEVDNMKESLDLLELLCWIVADPKVGTVAKEIEVLYVIAGREAASFSEDAFDGIDLDSKSTLDELSLIRDNPARRYHLRETIHATHAGMGKNKTFPPFYPILQSGFPPKEKKSRKDSFWTTKKQR